MSNTPRGRTMPIIAALEIARATLATVAISNESDVPNRAFLVEEVFGRVGSSATVDVLEAGRG